jgi:hypothetical protein
MGQYKVPQNVEAEDKIIGPLTFKQFVYALIGIGWGIICFTTLKTLPAVMILVGAPPVMLFLLLAFYTRDGQNFEQLLIAMVGFFANSRRRIWMKEEVVETFKIEPRKVEEEHSQRNPVEVRSQLEKLGTLIDSRGWNQPQVPGASLTLPSTPTDQRLVAPTIAPAVPGAPTEPAAGEDILDLQHSPLAQNLASLIEEAASDVRQEALHQMQATQPAATVSGVTAAPQGDILKLATERDDLTVSQLAATATRITPLAEGQSVDLRANGNTTTSK